MITFRRALALIFNCWTTSVLWLLAVLAALVAAPLGAPLPAWTWKALAVTAFVVGAVVLARFTFSVFRELLLMPDPDALPAVESSREVRVVASGHGRRAAA
ncbi:hypothetical protein [Pseudoclavibacter sp. 13-3]|uniref:hypothetical protein n=1 Tax=Pseudoclavibacter sp. 13-3 TaxID=2901228 RepID=UPI001E419095|nr:hypothetical protein [Pseudoclavibacter sp. 13-3]MCD7100471.1 hypothetical protein [Pseudoclavibacter sp. 13-3]